MCGRAVLGLDRPPGAGARLALSNRAGEGCGSGEGLPDLHQHPVREAQHVGHQAGPENREVGGQAANKVGDITAPLYTGAP